jgi:hypothetical protein
MRYVQPSALIRTAAALALVPLLAALGFADEPADTSDDLFVIACAVEDSAAPVQPQPEQAKAQPSMAPSDDPDCCYAPSAVQPAAPKTTQAAGDDLFLQLSTPNEIPNPFGESSTVKVTQSLEVVPAPKTLAPNESPQRLPSDPTLTGLNRPIVTLTLDAAANPELVANLSKLKTDVAIRDESIDRFGSWTSPTSEASGAPSRFNPQLVNWAAPAFYTNPLYFEQPNVERYGHYVGICDGDNLTQSAISAAHFFVCVPVLPYKIGAECPTECNYTLGSYRPGSCNPHQLVKPPLSLRGLVFEGAAATGLVFLLP